MDQTRREFRAISLMDDTSPSHLETDLILECASITRETLEATIQAFKASQLSPECGPSNYQSQPGEEPFQKSE